MLFPAELVNRFVHEVSLTSEKGNMVRELAPLLSVSQTFCQAVRPLIFGVLELTFFLSPRPDPRLSLLFEILDRERIILNLVQHVVIHFSDERHRSEGTNDPQELSAWTTLFPNVLELLAHAPIISLELRASTKRNIFAREYVSLTRLTPKATERLIDLRCLPSLETLTLSGLACVPSSILLGTREEDRLRRLIIHTPCTVPGPHSKVHPFPITDTPPTLRRAWFLSEGDTWPPPLQRLEELRLDNPRSFLNMVHPNPNDPDTDRSLPFLPAIKSLSVCNHDTALWTRDTRAINRILDRTPALEVFRFSNGFSDNPLIQIRGAKSLRKLYLTVYRLHGFHLFNSYLNNLASFLSHHLRQLCVLELLSIGFEWEIESIHGYASASEAIRDILPRLFRLADGSDGWGAIQQCLSNIAPSCRQLDLCVSLTLGADWCTLETLEDAQKSDTSSFHELSKALSLDGRLEVQSTLQLKRGTQVL